MIWIETKYKRRPRQRALGKLTPVELERSRSRRRGLRTTDPECQPIRGRLFERREQPEVSVPTLPVENSARRSTVGPANALIGCYSACTLCREAVREAGLVLLFCRSRGEGLSVNAHWPCQTPACCSQRRSNNDQPCLSIRNEGRNASARRSALPGARPSPIPVRRSADSNVDR